MNESTLETGQRLLFGEEPILAKSQAAVELAQATIGAQPDRQQQPEPLERKRESDEAIETVTFDMSNRDDVLKCADSALDKLERALNAGHSEGLQNYLKFLSRFHSYSFRNMMLIYLQNPDASLVAGYRAWQKLGRQVRKGERGLKILAPIVRGKKKDKADQGKEALPEKADGEPKKFVAGFRVTSVFDVSQTEGDGLPEFGGYSGDPAEYLGRLHEFAASKGITIVMEDPGGGALGVSQGGTIKVRPDLSPADTFAVMVHEVAHELLHKGERRMETTKSIRETEAEAVAYAVCSAVGLDDHSRAADYIQLHQGDRETFQQSLEFIRKTVSEILQGLSPDAELGTNA